MPSITFIVLVGNKATYKNCFLSSPLLAMNNKSSQFQIIAQSGFRSAAEAFNEGIERAVNDLIVCIHQDVILPVNWDGRLLERRAEVESTGSSVGVVGCWGITAEGERAGHVYHRDRRMFPRKPGDNGNRGAMSLPRKVQILDELMISFRKSSGLTFDPFLPSFFGYAVDLCLQAEERGLQNFAIDCPCIHQTADPRRIRKELFASANYLMKKWKKLLPIPTPSGPLEGNLALWRDRIKLRIQDAIGYTPSRVWWEVLPKVDPSEVLFADHSTSRK